MVDLSHLLYDWSRHYTNGPFSLIIPVERKVSGAGARIELDDETLRDGRQSPSLGRDAPLEERQEILRLIAALGIHAADLGLPGAGPHEVGMVRGLMRTLVDESLAVAPNCAARTLEVDIQPIVDISQEFGRPIEVAAFLGSSMMRQYVEEWTLSDLVQHTETAVAFAVRNSLPVMFVTEDTTRAHPAHLVEIYTAAIDSGAKRICLSDTVGGVTPTGAYNLVRFIREELLGKRYSGEDIKIDWHGHRDRGLALPNALAALAAGADRVHGCANGMGERAGNLEMEQILTNLVLDGYLSNDLNGLPQYCDQVMNAFGFNLVGSRPIVGKDVFTTGTGVHASAVIKAMDRGDTSGGCSIADVVYSGVPASVVGREQRIGVGPMSGKSNAAYWSRELLGRVDDAFVDILFAEGKASNGLLPETRIRELATPYLPK